MFNFGFEMVGAGKEAPLETLKVLMANDECFQLNAISMVMSKALNNGIQPAFAKNGHEALKHVQSNLKALSRKRNRHDLNSASSTVIPDHFCGIILDLNMPIMGGLEACERIVNAYKGFENHNDGKVIPLISTSKTKKKEKHLVQLKSSSERNKFKTQRTPSDDKFEVG